MTIEKTDRKAVSRMRDRLIELIGKGERSIWGKTICGGIKGQREYIADYLLENGVIVLPCNIEQSIYRCGIDKVYEWQIEHIEIYAEEIVFVDDSDNYFSADEIGKTVFLSKEEAERDLKRGMTDV